MPINVVQFARAATEHIEPVVPREHRITMTVGGKEISGWTDYRVDSSMIEPADRFEVTRPFELEAWRLCRLDAEVTIAIDGTAIITGRIDDRKKKASTGSMTFTGRDKVGRLVQESAPSSSYGGQRVADVVAKLASPWFSKVVLEDARNRRVRRGKGFKAPAIREPATLNSKTKGGRFDAGKTRFSIIEQLVSRDLCLCWSSGDGRELIIARPNYDQDVQFLCRHVAPGSTLRPTVNDLDYEESCGDRYSLIMAVGSGVGDDADYGDGVVSRQAQVLDGPGVDGIGRDFLAPKRLVLCERAFRDNSEASRVAGREQLRRDFRRQVAIAEMPLHGQIVRGQIRTLFAPNTLARVIDEELELDEDHLIFACSYSAARGTGERTTLQMVPRGTEFVL